MHFINPIVESWARSPSALHLCNVKTFYSGFASLICVICYPKSCCNQFSQGLISKSRCRILGPTVITPFLELLGSIWIVRGVMQFGVWVLVGDDIRLWFDHHPLVRFRHGHWWSPSVPSCRLPDILYLRVVSLLVPRTWNRIEHVKPLLEERGCHKLMAEIRVWNPQDILSQTTQMWVRRNLRQSIEAHSV